MNITCQNEKVYFSCDVNYTKSLTYSWQRNKKKLEKELNKEYNFSANYEKDGQSKFACTAFNPAHNKTSDEVKIECKYFSYAYFQSSMFFNLLICEYGMQSYK